ncbi:MAG: uroporphyrinogen decarboxylase family protein [Bacteroidota bacterium]|nr:uroporphyrinogen decarboxylase family protein [Bacteroidota bacterium]
MASSKQMTSRERVLAALNFETPDRVPIDLGGFQSGIHKRAYVELLNYLGKEEEIEMLDPVQQLVRPSEEILEMLRVDFRYVTAKGPETFDGTIRQDFRKGELWHDLRDEFGVVWSMPDKQQLYMDISYHPLAEANLEDIDSYPFPDGADPSRFKGVREEVLNIRKKTPYAVSTGIGGVVYETCWYMRGLERWFMDMMENPSFCEALLDRVLKFWLEYYTGFMKEIGDIIDVVMIGDDLAGQNGPLFPPEFYRSVVKPRQKKLVQHIRSLTNAKIWYHSCGAVVEYIPDLLDNGIDILNPVQITAQGMDPEFLKKRFGEELVFWGGGIDSQHILPFVSPEEVKSNVQANMEAFKAGGGYVFNNVHNIQAGVPPENILAMYEAAYEYGAY